MSFAAIRYFLAPPYFRQVSAQFGSTWYHLITIDSIRQDCSILTGILLFLGLVDGRIG